MYMLRIVCSILAAAIPLLIFNVFKGNAQTKFKLKIIRFPAKYDIEQETKKVWMILIEVAGNVQSNGTCIAIKVGSINGVLLRLTPVGFFGGLKDFTNMCKYDNAPDDLQHKMRQAISNMSMLMKTPCLTY